MFTLILFKVLVTSATFIFMEGVAWFTHKYIMHGFLWSLHHDHHHKPKGQVMERNDAFFLLFSVPAIALLIYGLSLEEGWNGVLPWIGIGITLYGMAYFFVHDIFIHQRMPFFKRTDNVYFRALRKAHKIHHKHLGKEDGECFGMLWVPIKYFIEARKK